MERIVTGAELVAEMVSAAEDVSPVGMVELVIEGDELTVKAYRECDECQRPIEIDALNGKPIDDVGYCRGVETCLQTGRERSEG